LLCAEPILCGCPAGVFALSCVSYSAAITEARAMNRAMEALEAWMSSNRLRLNSSKTQFIWLGTRQQLAKIDLEALAQEFPQITFSQWQEIN